MGIMITSARCSIMQSFFNATRCVRTPVIPYNACRFLSTNKDDIVVTERLSDAKGKRAACLAKIYLIYLKMQIMRELLVMKNF